MIKDNERSKLVNSIIYFVENTENCGKTKLFKLLYFLDFQHYQEVGRSVTGLDYYAWPMGPVPKTLFEELENPETGLSDCMKIEHKDLRKSKNMLIIKPKQGFDHTVFSRRETRILESLAKEFYSSLADDMVEATHLENLPWHQIYEVEKKKQELIPYSYAIRKSEESEMTKLVNEHEDFLRNYK